MLETYVYVNNKPSEWMAKEYMFRVHLLPAFGRLRLDAITRRDVEEFKAEKLGEGITPKTVNNVLSGLSKLLKYAEETEVIEHALRIKFLKLPTP